MLETKYITGNSSELFPLPGISYAVLRNVHMELCDTLVGINYSKTESNTKVFLLLVNQGGIQCMYWYNSGLLENFGIGLKYLIPTFP